MSADTGEACRCVAQSTSAPLKSLEKLSLLCSLTRGHLPRFLSGFLQAPSLFSKVSAHSDPPEACSGPSEETSDIIDQAVNDGTGEVTGYGGLWHGERKHCGKDGEG